MMMRKRAIAAFAVIIGALLVMSGLTGCGSKEEEDPSNDPYWPRGYIEETLEGGFVVRNYKDGSRALCEYTGNATEITIPTSITRIEWAFSGNDSITKVTIPDNVTLAIGANAFNNCTALETVIIGNGVTEIGNFAFSDCTSLIKLEIPDSVTTIGERAFCGLIYSPYSGEPCPTRLEEVIIGKGLKTIGEDAFMYCDNIKTVSYKGTLKEWCAVDKDWSLLSSAESVRLADTEVPDLKEKAGDDGFKISIPAGVTRIGNASFYHSTLTSIDIPDSVTSIGNYAFAGCKPTEMPSLKNVTEIGEHAFYNCTVQKPLEVTEVVKLELPKVTSIGKYAFDSCNITSVTIPNSMTKIGEGVFHRCEKLTEVTIPNTVTEIGNDAFWGCVQLLTITIPNSVTKIGYYAFAGCRFTQIEIPASVTKIYNSAFSGNDKLESVVFKDPNGWWRTENVDYVDEEVVPLGGEAVPPDLMGDAKAIAKQLTDIAGEDTLAHKYYYYKQR